MKGAWPWLVAACIGTAQAAIQEEIVTLPAGDGVSLPYLRSSDDGKPPRALAVLFTGSGGRLGLARHGIPRPGRNFLVRTRNEFNRQGIATALIDVPSDQVELTDAYRRGKRHAEEVASVVADMRRRFGDVPAFLVGTSRGTVSAAHAGAALGSALAGVVLSSSLFNATRHGPGLSGFDYSSVRSKLLFVHHAEDACPQTPYHVAERLGRRYPLVTVRGGDPPASAPCDPFSPHGYFGVEGPTVRAIADWMLGGPAQKSVP